MKGTFLFGLLLAFCGTMMAQETFKKKFILHNTILLEGNDTVFLQTDRTIKFSEMSISEQDKLTRRYPFGQIVEIKSTQAIDGKLTEIIQQVLVDSAFYHRLSQTVPAKVGTAYILKAYVKFDEDKVIVNPYLQTGSSGSYSRSGISYYTLKNRQSIRLKFREVTLSALTIPLKYRFKRDGAEEEFSTSVNGNVFAGYSWGKTSFFHQTKVGNISNTSKFTLGVLLGASSVKLNAANTDQTAEPVTAETTKGLGSLGVGGSYTFNKLNFGIFTVQIMPLEKTRENGTITSGPGWE